MPLNAGIDRQNRSLCTKIKASKQYFTEDDFFKPEINAKSNKNPLMTRITQFVPYQFIQHVAVNTSIPYHSRGNDVGELTSCAYPFIYRYLHGMPRTDSVHVLCMPRVNFRPRADTLDVRYWFWLQIRTRHPWKPRNWPKNYGVSWTILYMNENPLLVKIAYIPVRTSRSKWWPFKYWWSALPSKVCKKVQVRSWWRSYIYGVLTYARKH